MNIISKNKVQDLINNGYDIDLGSYINKGFELFKKDMGLFIGAFFIYLLLCWVPFLNIILMNNFMLIAYKMDQGEKASINDLFNFDKAGKLIGYFILLSFVIVLLFIPYIFAIFYSVKNQGEPNIQLMVGSYAFLLVCMIPIYGFTAFCVPLLKFGDYSIFEAVSTSTKLAKKNFWMILLVVFVIGMIGSLGVIACYIGMIASIPASYCMLYEFYKAILFTQDEHDINLIGPEDIH